MFWKDYKMTISKRKKRKDEETHLLKVVLGGYFNFERTIREQFVQMVEAVDFFIYFLFVIFYSSHKCHKIF